MSRTIISTRKRFAGLLAIGILVSLLLTPPPVAAANCASSGPAGSAYTVTVCITAPPSGVTLNGNQTVTATASVTGTNPGVQRMIFNLDNAYLITDYQSPYTFSWPTASYVDGSHTLQAQAQMRDAFMTTLASISLDLSNGVTSPPVNNRSFTPAPGTNPGAGQPLVIGAVGDGAGGEANSANVVNLIKGWNPNLFLYLGDVYEKGSPLEFYNWYNPSNFYGAFRAITNPTIGNHEYGNGAGPGYVSYWDNAPTYYSYNASGWHFISLNSTSQFNQVNPGSPQYQWLQKDLAANAGACTIAYFHHPVYSVGPHGDRPLLDPIWSLLYSARVTLVLTGHEHDYQRWVPLDGAGNPASDGITQIIVGTGGHGITGFVRTDSRLAKGVDSSSSFGALRLRLGSTSADFAFINTAGTVVDSGTIPCQGSAPAPTSTPTNTPLAPTATNTPLQPTPTNTPLPSTNTPTNTPVGPTSTRTNTPTNTPLPPTVTPTATRTPATTTVNPVADAYVDASKRNVNFGSSTQLRVERRPVVQSYLRFSVGGLAGMVKQAQIQIYADSSLSSGITAYRVADNTWGETTITYKNAPALGSAIGTSSAVSSGTWITIDVTSYVTGNGTLSFALTSESGKALSMASREAANKPRLVITTQ